LLPKPSRQLVNEGEKQMIIVTGRVRVHADQRDAAILAAEGMRKHTIDEPGCVDYRFWSATDDHDAILLFEQWEEQAALEAHLAAPHMAAFLAQIGAAVDGTLEVTRFEVSNHGPLFG
jgi:quinol monooxygenase YgiN